MFILIVWSRGFEKNWDGGQIGEGGDGGEVDNGGAQVAELHCPLKSVIPAIFVYKFVDPVTSAIDIVFDV